MNKFAPKFVSLLLVTITAWRHGGSSVKAHCTSTTITADRSGTSKSGLPDPGGRGAWESGLTEMTPLS